MRVCLTAEESPGVWASSQVLLAVCVLLTHQHVHWTVDTLAKTDPGFPKMTWYAECVSVIQFFLLLYLTINQNSLFFAVATPNGDMFTLCL